LENEIEVRDKQIDLLNDRVLVLDHENKQLQGLKSSLEKLKSLEKECDRKDGEIVDLKKKVQQ
jgi:hypothetical protein